MARPKKTDNADAAATAPAAPNKKQAIAAAVNKLRKQFGEGSIMILESDMRVNMEVHPTELADLDRALGVGGFPKGRMIELYGPESSGKSTLCLHVIREVQSKGGTCAYIDIEHSIDKTWAKKIGVDTEKLYLIQPDNGEQAMTTLQVLAESGGLDVIVIDSVAALSAIAEQDADMESQTPGVQARLMSKALRKVTACVAKTKTLAIFINQVREKIGGYGNPETTPGGHALKHAASIRVCVRKGDKINGTDKDDVVGQMARFSVVKNKCATPYKTAEAPIYFDRGYDKFEDLVRVAVELEVFEKKGAWLAFEGTNVAQGVDKASAALRENPDLFKKVWEAYKTKIDNKIKVVETLPPTPEDEEDKKHEEEVPAE